MDGAPSRRAFLAWSAAALVMPAALTACRRKPTATTPSQAEPAINLDEVEAAASFRPRVPETEPSVRVRILKVRDAPGAAALRVGQSDQWLRVRGGAESAGKGSALSAPIEIMMEPGGWSITDAKGFRAAAEGREPVEISPIDAEPGELLTVWSAGPDTAVGKGAPQYPGSLRLVARDDLSPSGPQGAQASGFVDVINDVPVELYLPGVLAGELYSTWNAETFAAQAVAARSFACSEAALFSDRRHYDVTNTAASQMYLGAS